MSDISASLKTATARLDAAKTRKVRAEVEKSQAEASLADTQAALREFGVKTSADITRVRKELSDYAEAEMAEVERLLAEAGA